MTDKLNALRAENIGKLPTYAWPGGYPMFYMAADGETFCPSCANQDDAEPPIVHAEINYEDADLHCDGCGTRIESAYTPEDH